MSCMQCRRFCSDQDGELLTNFRLLLLSIFFNYYFSLNGQSRVTFTNADSPVTSNTSVAALK